MDGLPENPGDLFVERFPESADPRRGELSASSTSKPRPERRPERGRSPQSRNPDQAYQHKNQANDLSQGEESEEPVVLRPEELHEEPFQRRPETTMS